MFWDPKLWKLVYSDSATFDEREFPGTSQPKELILNLLPNIEKVVQHLTGDEASLDDPAILVAGQPITHPNIGNTLKHESDQPPPNPQHNAPAEKDSNGGGSDNNDDDEGEEEIDFARAFAMNTQMETKPRK
jgi:hypothetical protein